MIKSGATNIATHLKRGVVVIALLAIFLLLISGPGTRFGLWQYGTGFLLMRIAFFAALGAAGLALVLLVFPKTRAAGTLALVVTLVIGLGTAWVPYSGVKKARSLPYIHDITTDTVNVPPFLAILPLRSDAPNPPEYPGEAVAAQQREAYPDLTTLKLDTSAGEAFARALAVATTMDWEIVAADAAAGRIEATDTTFWFGFKDDVVIRIQDTGSSSQLDVRSKSRVGRSDVGANAARIRRFTAAFTSD